jgi:hypothetical protein
MAGLKEKRCRIEFRFALEKTDSETYEVLKKSLLITP